MEATQPRPLAQYMCERIERELPDLQARWAASSPVRHVFVDDLLPEGVARGIAANFPPLDSMVLKRTIREHKRVGVDVDRYAPEVNAALFAFQDPGVIEAVSRITGLTDLAGDSSLYAAGLSAMGSGDFLAPHVDNSHDGDGRFYRAINVLYYVSPGWELAYGGNLELWEPTVREQVTVHSRFNRLVVMATDRTSWHSVSPIVRDAPRYCVSNYYFTTSPPGGVPYRHVTTFTGRPEEPLKRAVLAVTDSFALNAVGRLFPSLVKRNKHRIRKQPAP